MDRALQANIIAKSGKAVEMAGDIDVVLLDKTGTITVGNRHATEFLPVGKYTQRTSSADWRRWPRPPTRRPRARASSSSSRSNPRITRRHAVRRREFVPFTAQTRMSGIDFADGRRIRKGAPDAVVKFVQAEQGHDADAR